MKTKYIVLGIVVLLVLILIIILLIPKIKPTKRIENISHLRFTYTTGYHMNASVMYEINKKDDKYIVSIKPTDIPDEEVHEVEISSDVLKGIENKLNEFSVGKWDGFNKNDKFVLDGNSFSMNIRLEDDNTIEASGYMMWPDNYREVRDYLDSVLGSLY